MESRDNSSSGNGDGNNNKISLAAATTRTTEGSTALLDIINHSKIYQ